MKKDGTDLLMICGDSESITVERKENGIVAPFVFGDTVYFTVKLNTATEAKLFQKVITIFDDGKAVIEIEPEDTEVLPYKTYKYDIQWVSTAGRVVTLVPPSGFTVAPHITFER